GEGQFDLEDGAGLIFEAADDGRIDPDAVGTVAGSGEQQLHGGEVGDALVVGRRVAADIVENNGYLPVIEFGALGEVAALILAALAEQQANVVDAELIELVDGTQHRELLAVLGDAGGFEHAVEHLAVVDLDHVLTR